MVVNQSTPLSRILYYPPWNRTVTNETLCSTVVWDLAFLDPWPMTGDYRPPDAVAVLLETFETYTPPTPTTETTQITTTTTTTTVPLTTTAPQTTSTDTLGRMVLGGALGLIICVVPVILWKTQKN